MSGMDREMRRRPIEEFKPEPHRPSKPCPQEPGTILRVFIPAGAVINLAGLIEVTSPSGICLIVRLPFLGRGRCDLGSILDGIKKAGGSFEFMEE
jgi:hypothetical protein